MAINDRKSRIKDEKNLIIDLKAKRKSMFREFEQKVRILDKTIQILEDQLEGGVGGQSPSQQMIEEIQEIAGVEPKGKPSRKTADQFEAEETSKEEKRGPGRPPKKKKTAAKETGDSAPKRGPGRPKKRGPGRPKKAETAEPAKKKRGPGRPKKRGPKKGQKVSFTDMVVNAVKEADRFIHNKDILNRLHEKYPNEDQTELSKKISMALYRMKKMDVLEKFQPGTSRKQVFWGMKEWLDENGNIKKDFTIGTKNKE